MRMWGRSAEEGGPSWFPDEVTGGPGPACLAALTGLRGPGDRSIPRLASCWAARGPEEPPSISYAGFLFHPPHDQRESHLIPGCFKTTFRRTLVFETVARRWPEMTVRPRWPCVSPPASAHGRGALLRGHGGDLGGDTSLCDRPSAWVCALSVRGAAASVCAQGLCAPDCARMCQRVVSAVERIVGVCAGRACRA